MAKPGYTSKQTRPGPTQAQYAGKTLPKPISERQDLNSIPAMTGIPAYDFVAPRYQIMSNNFTLNCDLTDRIQSVDVDFDIDKATEITIHLHDYDGYVSNHKALAEGNLIHVSFGYGSDIEYLASGEVVRWDWVYPRDGKPILNVHAYDGSHASMDRQGHKGGSVMKKVRDSKVVTHKITEHMGFIADCDETDGIQSRIQRKGISDWQFIKRLALINDFYIWCDYNWKHNRWWVHFRDKGKLRLQQELMYSFIYGNDVAVSLLDWKLDFSMRGMPTDMEILSFSRDEKKEIKAITKETKGLYTDHAPGRGTTDPSERIKKRRKDSLYVHKMREPSSVSGFQEILHKRTKIEDSSFKNDEVFKDPMEKGTTLTFTCFGQRIYVVADKPFTSLKQAGGWAARFMKSQLENFVMGSGSVVGTPYLRPRQIHYLGGLGPRFSGKWEFTKVKHKMLTEGPYECDIEARRLYEPTNPKGNPVQDKKMTVPRMIMRIPGGSTMKVG